MMKKIIKVLSIGTGIFLSNLQAQTNVNFGDFSKPVPSVSSFATYTNTPTSNATGIPDISFPLLGLPSYNSGVSLNIGLSYNPMNVSESEAASQVGRGWSLFAGGVISRSIENDIDEFYDNPNAIDYYKNEFDDTYYYNLPGISGKFKIVRDITNNSFKLSNLTANKIKLDYTPDTNTATLIIKSFKITDTKGIQYTFTDFSRSNQERNVSIPGGKLYRSAFFLTKINDANGVELASFSYQKDVKYKNNSTTVAYETCKLKNIISPGFGKIEFEYSYDPALEYTMTDPYQVQKVVLKDNYNHMISGYAFEYSSLSGRILSKLKKLTKNNTVSEITEFEYGNAANIAPSPALGTDPSMICPELVVPFPSVGEAGILKRVVSPSGGVVEYNFEQNLRYIDRTSQSYLDNGSILTGNAFTDPEVQYLNQFWTTDYDTHVSANPASTFTITGTASKRVFVQFVAEELYTDNPLWDPSVPYYMSYVIKSGGVALPAGNTCQSPMFNGSFYTAEYNLSPGTYTIQFSGSGGKGGVGLYEIAHVPQPFINITRGVGVRIANIKYYNSKTDTTPVKTTKFEYKSFSDSNASSGYSVVPGDDPNASSYIIYKNVKVSNTDDGNGYVKYYYKIPDDFPKQEPYVVNGVNGKFLPAYNIINSGLLDKKEVYDAQNRLLASEQTDYTFDNIPGAEDYMIPLQYVYGEIRAFSKLGWLKKEVGTSKTYFENNQSIEESSETNFNVFNFEVASTKKVVDGNVMESFTTYPETGYPKLMESNIKSLPVMTEQKIDGELVSKTETKFDNTSSTLPTSMVMTNIAGMSKSSSIDLYDEKGNAIQLTSPTGVSTSIVYGYDKTQPIARIEGATYAQISSWIQTIINASNADAQNPANENALLLSLDNFRKQSALQNTQVTTYTYDPLIGITTVTSSSGIREIYQYDNQNRLVKIVDMNGATLKEYQYNYKN